MPLPKNSNVQFWDDILFYCLRFFRTLSFILRSVRNIFHTHPYLLVSMGQRMQCCLLIHYNDPEKLLTIKIQWNAGSNITFFIVFMQPMPWHWCYETQSYESYFSYECIKFVFDNVKYVTMYNFIQFSEIDM